MCACLGSHSASLHAAGQSRRTLDETGLGQVPAAVVRATRHAELGHHDAVVALIGERGVMCSGVLVHPRVILTARHCGAARQVVFGADAREPRLSRNVLDWRAPPNPALDVALALIEAVQVQPYPIRAAAPDEARRVRVVGFGVRRHDDARSGGRRSYFDVSLRRATCDHATAATTGCLPGLELLIPRSAGADSCSGDSGGPVLERHEGGWRTVAITSRSVSRALLPCGDGGIYVRTDAIASWLERQLEGITSEESHD